MKKSKVYGPFIGLFLVFWTSSSILSAQMPLPTLDLERQITISNELALIPEADLGKRFYFLPLELKIKTNKNGQPMFSLLKFVGNETSGTLLNAHFTLEPDIARNNDIQDGLISRSEDNYYAGPYPFYQHEQFYGKFENIDLIMELVNRSGREELWRHKAALTTNSLVIAAKLPDTLSTFLWETLPGNSQQKIEFKIEVNLKTMDYLDHLNIIFNPRGLKEYLLNTQDSTKINYERFSQIIKSILKNNETALIEIGEDSGAYNEEELIKLITAKVADQLFDDPKEREVISSSTTSSSRTVTRRVVINGKVVEKESTTDKVEGKDKPEFDKTMNFRQDQYLSASAQQYYLGRKAVEIQTYPLRFNLSDFYRQHSKLFKTN